MASVGEGSKILVGMLHRAVEGCFTVSQCCKSCILMHSTLARCGANRACAGSHRHCC